MGIAVLEIAAAAAAHQQGVTGEGQRLVVEHEGEAAIGVAGGGAHLEAAASEGDPIPMRQGPRDVLGACLGGQGDGATGGPVHQPAAGDVVGMGMGIQAGHQIDAELANQGQIAVVLLEHRIDEHALGAVHVGEQVGEGAGVPIKELAEQQISAPGGSPQEDMGKQPDSHASCPRNGDGRRSPGSPPDTRMQPGDRIADISSHFCSSKRKTSLRE